MLLPAPTGRLNSELLTYSRSKGAFAGLTLEGAVIEQDSDSTEAIYGRDIPFRRVLTGNVTPPAVAAPFMSAVEMAGHKAATNEAKDQMEGQEIVSTVTVLSRQKAEPGRPAVFWLNQATECLAPPTRWGFLFPYCQSAVDR